jgi:hypothetical protein
MTSKKSPYLGYSEEEVKRIESGHFVLNFGGDFVLQDNNYVFTKKEVSKIHRDILKKLLDILSNGSEKDRSYALDLMGGLVIQPMKLH